MCKHHWMLGATRDNSTPARCKLCGKERVFRAKDLSWADSKDKRKKPSIHQPQVNPLQVLPFDPHRYTPRVGSKYRGTKL